MLSTYWHQMSVYTQSPGMECLQYSKQYSRFHVPLFVPIFSRLVRETNYWYHLEGAEYRMTWTWSWEMGKRLSVPCLAVVRRTCRTKSSAWVGCKGPRWSMDTTELPLHTALYKDIAKASLAPAALLGKASVTYSKSSQLGAMEKAE